ncbi:DUF4124 domain-containing protein [Lysobacter panacisoli]|uniref:DUF4124 domain-containing protein n=1 Tax=Lysobacter panacisoli TaxID=1255263 RepID=A0ABP9LTK0_9GAMM|nr:DUF4124 domain-containing protein [Lysobacter panacisoli]
MHPIAKGFAVAAALMIAASVSTPARADVFKCTVDGRTVYQDKPCAGVIAATPQQRTARSETAGGIRVPEYLERPPMPGATPLAILHRQILDAEAYSRRLHTAYDADVRLTRARVAGLPMDQQNREAEALHAKWDSHLQQASKRSDDLMKQLRRECPGGAALSEGREVCRR